MTEREKMLSGEVYDACDAELLKDLNAVKVLCQQSLQSNKGDRKK